jgi:hypothetical protein
VVLTTRINPADKFKTSDEKEMDSVQGVLTALPTNKLFPEIFRQNLKSEIFINI